MEIFLKHICTYKYNYLQLVYTNRCGIIMIIYSDLLLSFQSLGMNLRFRPASTCGVYCIVDVWCCVACHEECLRFNYNFILWNFVIIHHVILEMYRYM